MKKTLLAVHLACAALLFAQSAAADGVVRSFERMLSDSRATHPATGTPGNPGLPVDAAGSVTPSTDPLLPYFQAALWNQRPMPGKALDAAANTRSRRPL